jgi:D-alanine-D-alanine ligase
MRVLLLTGPGGDAQGWGDMSVTQSVADAATSAGHPARIAFVETEQEFLRIIGQGGFDIVWSALCHPEREVHRARRSGMWVADVLTAGASYIGSKPTMKDMIDKFKTHETLQPGSPCQRLSCAARTVVDVSPGVREADGRSAVGISDSVVTI